MNSEQLTKRITELIFEKKGYDVKLLNLNAVTTMADYFIICSADSDTQVQAVAHHVEKTLRDDGVKCWHKEGTRALQWVLLDYVDVVVHIFRPEQRQFYNLERLWGDAQITEIKDEPVKPKRVRKVKSE